MFDRLLNAFREESRTISSEILEKRLDNFLAELNGNDDEILFARLNEVLPLLIEIPGERFDSLMEHKFSSFMRESLRKILHRWHRETQLNSKELALFWNLTRLLKKIYVQISSISLLIEFFSDANLLEQMSENLGDLSKFAAFVRKDELKLFSRLIHLLNKLQNESNRFDVLLDPMIECLLSENAVLSFVTLLHHIKGTEKFFLIKCSAFVRNSSKTCAEPLVKNLLEKYQKKLSRSVDSVDCWPTLLVRAVDQLLKLIQLETNIDVFHGKFKFIDSLIKIVDSKILLDRSISNPRTSLIDSTLSLIAFLSKDPTILTRLKQKNLAEIALRLQSKKDTLIRQHVQTILSNIATENDIKKLKKRNSLLDDLMKNLRTHIENQLTDENQELDRDLLTLQGFLQHDQIKQDLIERNHLPFLLKSVEKLDGDRLQALLKIIWSMCFHKESAELIQKDENFLKHVDKLAKDTQNEGIKKASDGLVWKLIQEPVLLKRQMKKIVEQNATETVVGEDGKSTVVKKFDVDHGERKFAYDMMISYCHADKEIVHKIYHFLEAQGFKIWIDLNHMHGPAMAAMAEAVENSEFLVMCMSESYKKSTYCQAEAEYGFNCKRRIVPLIVRPKYRADGWLGFLIGSRIYVDFGTFDFDQACEKLIHEIQLQRKRPLPSKPEPKTNSTEKNEEKQPQAEIKTKPVEVTPKRKSKSRRNSSIDRQPEKSLPDVYTKRSSSRRYREKPISTWKESDVLDFLFNENLRLLMPMCENMDGAAFLELHRMSKKESSGTYSMLNKELKADFNMTLPVSVYARFISYMDTLVSGKAQCNRNSNDIKINNYQTSSQPGLDSRTIFSRSMDPNPMVNPSFLPYDVLVTSNAPVPEILTLVQNYRSQLPNAINRIHY